MEVIAKSIGHALRERCASHISSSARNELLVVVLAGCRDTELLAQLQRLCEDERGECGVCAAVRRRVVVLENTAVEMPSAAVEIGGLFRVPFVTDASDWCPLLVALSSGCASGAESVLHVHCFGDVEQWSCPVRVREDYFQRAYQHIRETRSSLLVILGEGRSSAASTGVPDGQTADAEFDAVRAESFFLAAAREGLFTRQPPICHPGRISARRITVGELEVRGYRIRQAHPEDLGALFRLEEACWAEGLRMPLQVLEGRLRTYPEGQLVLEIDEPAEGRRVVGVIYSQRISLEDAVLHVQATTAHTLHEPEAPVVQLLAINIEPSFQERQAGDELLEFMLQRCTLARVIRSVIAVTLCRSFRAEAGMSLGDYIGQRNDLGQLADPILRFHERHGAHVERLVPGYRPNDAKNEGAGVLVSYDLERRVRKPPAALQHQLDEPTRRAGLESASAHEVLAEPARGGYGQRVEDLAEFLEATIRHIVRPPPSWKYSVEQPLMELGLDSIGLTELAERISIQCGLQLRSSFLFEHNTPRRIAEFFASSHSSVPAPDTARTREQALGEFVAGSPAAPDRSIPDGAIAVIGMALRLPGGIDTPEQLWDCLEEGRCMLGALPPGRWSWPEGIDPVRTHPGIESGGFIEGIAGFDASLFRISPKEARTMDPQQRLSMELAWEALESCGYCVDSVAGSKTGVFIGASGSDYRLLVEQAGVEIEPHFATGSSMAILANRVSYFFDLRGPSIQIDTACSSSLVAVHQAVEALRRGACTLALVGGVNLMCHPANTIAYYKAGMLSRSGRCRTFDQHADGYVRAEGAVMLVLKPLRAALRDHDPIQALIRGSACNHGGLAGGLTVPNPRQQAELLKEAWADAAVDPSSIGFIEMHGTGTKLGDPAEVRGLTRAMMSEVAEGSANRCGLSSIKTNLGHLEAAAGIAALVKVVLSLEHGELPRSLHFETLNSDIELKQTPFYVVREHEHWPRRGSVPRRAGVSSFGSGGTNAHAVLEEYQVIEAEAPPSPAECPLLCILSAADRERLAAYAQRLVDYLSRSSAGGRIPVESVVYSLQRRQALDERVAFLVSSRHELEQRLGALARGAASPDLYQGNVTRDRTLSDFVGQFDDIRAVVRTWVETRQLERVAKLWTKGVPVDNWEALYNPVPRRVRLPGYPFARQHHWVEPRALASASVPPPHAGSAGPGLDQRAVAVAPNEFCWRLEGTEFFVSDHRISGKAVLPAAASVEMVCDAIHQATGGRTGDARSVELRDVVWVRPIVVEGPQSVHLRLSALGDGSAAPGSGSATVSFDIGPPQPAPGGALSYCSGAAALPPTSRAPGDLDLPAIRDRFERAPHEVLGAGAYYAALERLGFNYGPAHRALTSLLWLDGGEPELLAEIVLPACIAVTRDRYHAHPSLVDAAIQAAIAVASKELQPGSRELALPFAAQSIWCGRPCAERMWAWVRPHARGSVTASARVDLDLCDPAGRVCLAMRGLEFRGQGREHRQPSLPPIGAGSDWAPHQLVWREKPLPARRPAATELELQGVDQRVVVCGLDERSHELREIRKRFPRVATLPLEPAQGSIAERFMSAASRLLELIQGLLAERIRGRTVLQVIVPGAGMDGAFAALFGLARCASLEEPKLSVQILACSGPDSVHALLAELDLERAGTEDALVRYAGNARLVRSLQPVRSSRSLEQTSPWKEGGNYLITGGLGGLGRIFLKEILARVHFVNLVLVGRSPADASTQASLRDLERPGARIYYRAVDVGDSPAVAELMTWIEGEVGALNGIVHCAGVTRDGFLMKKDAASLEAVLRPKVPGTCNLYQHASGSELDFFVSFSSIVSLTGNIGQSDYCTANAFLDEWSKACAAAARAPRCRVLSINWPLWQAGGMGQNLAARQQLEADLGLHPMETSLGTSAFYRALASSEPQIVFANERALRAPAWQSIELAATRAERPRQPSLPQASAPASAPAPLEGRVLAYLKATLSQVLGLPAESLAVDAPFSSLGLDSILALQLIKQLEVGMGSLSKTLLFEHENLQQLSQYLRAEKAARLEELLRSSAAGPSQPSHSAPVAKSESIAPRPAQSSQAEEAREPSGYRFLDKADCLNDPALASLVAAASGRQHDVALMSVWPEIFLDRAGQSYCHVLRDEKVVFAAQFEGKPERRAELLNALAANCARSGLALGYLDMSEGRKRDLEERCEWVSAAVGVVQTIDDVARFSLAGGRMRRLRYMVEAFKKLGTCRTVECRTLDAALVRDIQHVIEDWCQAKKVVNNVDVILDEIERGTLLARYRVFLTYVGPTLSNVILILPISGGYLMDQEYYLAQMPKGGTEFAVTQILEQLAAEGHREFSLGLTWALLEAREGNSDAAGSALLRGAKTQLARIFERGAANHQYKQKYGPRQYDVYFYRHRDSDPRVLVDCLSQFFRKGITHHEVERRIAAANSAAQAQPAAPHYDVMKVEHSRIRLDLVSDSWSHLDYGFIGQRMTVLSAQRGGGPGAAGDGVDAARGEVVRSLFGLPHFCLTSSGRMAEHLFFRARRSQKRLVPQNLLFESTLHNLVKAGFEPIEIPDRNALDRRATALFRGGVDLEQLAQLLEKRASEVAFILIELANNASGGYPVSLGQLRSLVELRSRYGVPLVLDVTRVLQNAELIRRYESGYGDRDLFDIVRESASCADVIFGSLSKDFGIGSGGIVAASDAAALRPVEALARLEGGKPAPLDAELMYAALRDRAYARTRISCQVDHVRELHERLAEAGVAVIQPGAGHCVLVPADEMPGQEGRERAVENVLRTLVERHGVRGGVHFVGGRSDTHLNRCVRLALPLGLEDERLIPALVDALRACRDGCDSVVPNLVESTFAERCRPVHSPSDAAVAIIGLSGRYPGANDVEEFWSNLVAGRQVIAEVPEERWDWREYFEPNPLLAVDLGKSYGKWGSFLDGFYEFDPLFFRMSPQEAEKVDPQERLFLMECWKALEDAGHPPAAFSPQQRRRVGVFGGITKQGFNLYAAAQPKPYHNTSLATMVCRVSHCLDLKGPALAFDSHCASALVAIHEACEYIRAGKGDLAIAGAVNLNLHPFNYAQLSKMRVLAQGQCCAAFGSDGSGYVPGEGAGAVILKNHARAIADGDHIYGVIRGSAINHNGKMNRFGMPSQKQIEAVMHAALEQAEVDPRSISYVECSAHGSEVGDAVEMAALGNVFGQRSGARDGYRMGSVKPNIGHGEAVSGMSQLTKVLLSFRYHTLAPTLLPEQLNSNIDFDHLPFELQASAGEWSPPTVDGDLAPRRAGVTSTGASGVNVHLVLEEHRPGPAVAAPSPSAIVFVLSARDAERLREYGARWLAFLRKGPEQDLGAIVHMLQTGREAMASRLAIVAMDVPDLLGKLERWLELGEGSRCDATFSSLALGPGAPTTPMAASGAGSALELVPGHTDARELARRWVAGASVDWAAFYGMKRPPRVGGLPTYPFARERCWPADLAASLRNAEQLRVGQSAAADGPLASSPSHGTASPAAAQAAPLENLEAALSSRLFELVAEVFKLPAERLDAAEPLEAYGIDSYLVTVLTVRLVAIFPKLSSTALYECQTLKALAQHLLARHPDETAGWVVGLAEAASVLPASQTNGSLPRQRRALAPQPAREPSPPRTDAFGAAEYEPIAIIGVSGQYPMAKNLQELWENLKSGRDCITEIPGERWPLDGFYEPDQERAIASRRCYSKWGGFVDGFCDFDPLFFNISPREAMNMDPQERLFLQACWRVLEDAAYTRQRIAEQHSGRVGVFAGVTRSEFGLYGPALWAQGKAPYTSFCSLVNRVSYFLNAHGPSLPIDTMCSSSLVAVHEACEHLLRGDCELAIAGGVNLSLHPYMYVSLSAQRMLSRDGHCRSFAEGASGYVPGEGVGVILLKRLSRALADGDRIYGLIRGTSVNHGGKTNGYTVPNPIAQADVIRRALDRARVNARAVSYVEAHGTGTELGDPIEVTGLSLAFEKDTRDTGYCALGSIKSNIGHLEAASGIVGLTKVLLQMRHGVLVPSLHAEQLNPRIDFESSPFVVNRALRDWQRPVVNGVACPRIAGVSSFGAGGSNAHVILEEYVRGSRSSDGAEPSQPVLIVLSAKKPDRLREYAQQLLNYVSEPGAMEQDGGGLQALAHTLQLGREAMDERLGLIVRSVGELQMELREFLEGKPGSGLRVGKARRSEQHVQPG